MNLELATVLMNEMIPTMDSKSVVRLSETCKFFQRTLKNELEKRYVKFRYDSVLVELSERMRLVRQDLDTASVYEKVQDFERQHILNIDRWTYAYYRKLTPWEKPFLLGDLSDFDQPRWCIIADYKSSY